MLDKYNLLLFLIFICIGVLCYLIPQYMYPVILGSTVLGGNCDYKAIISKRPIYFDNYIIDGSNLIYSLYHTIKRKKHISNEDYNLYTKRVSLILRSALPDKNIHVVIKNLENESGKNESGKNESGKNESGKNESVNVNNLLNYKSIKNIFDLSKICKNINYHIAFDSSKSQITKHSDLARDDILSILLSKQFSDNNSSACLITNDKLKDYTKFKHTHPFKYFTIKNCKIKDHGIVNPEEISHNPPNNIFSYNLYSINNEEYPDINGEIHEHNSGPSCLYLKYYHI